MKNLAALIIVIVFAVELYLAAAGTNHRKKKPVKGWDIVQGKITGIEKKEDPISKKQVCELTIQTPVDAAPDEARVINAKVSQMFCIYEEEEIVDLEVKDGYHRFLGNDRVDAKGKKESFWGIVPVLVLLAISMVLSYLF